MFGKYSVIGKVVIKGKENRTNWLCRCICGAVRVFRGDRLTSGRSTGCNSCNNGNLAKPFKGRYNMLVGQCKLKGRECLISYEEYLTFTITDKCHYCGVKILWKPHGDQSSGHKLDRKDNNLTYTLENCVVCCPRCNWTKGDHFTYDEWKQIGELIRSW